jgi:hypothetical protein
VPRHHQDDRLRLERPRAGDHLIEIARQRLLARRFRRLRPDRRQEMTADDVDAEFPRMVAGDEVLDVAAGANQKDALGRW